MWYQLSIILYYYYGSAHPTNKHRFVTAGISISDFIFYVCFLNKKKLKAWRNKNLTHLKVKHDSVKSSSDRVKAPLLLKAAKARRKTISVLFFKPVEWLFKTICLTTNLPFHKIWRILLAVWLLSTFGLSRSCTSVKSWSFSWILTLWTLKDISLQFRDKIYEEFLIHSYCF